MEDIIFSEATIITDRNGEQLYKLYQENREYVALEKMSEHMVNAIIAVEDQKFRTNKGYDLQGIMRAVINNIFNSWQIQGASTITQQLVKNLLLSNERTYTRKLKELMLTQKLHSLIKSDIKKEYNNLGKDESQQKMKEKVLEMYLNYIFLGQNTYGVQSAARTYFGTSAAELTPLQSAILASIPKSPSKLNPYKNKDLLMWRLVVKKNNQMVQMPEWFITQIKERIETNFKNINLDKKDTWSFIKIIVGLSEFPLTHEGVTYQVFYEPWKKDYSLMNMYDEWYIDQVILKKAFLQWLDYVFKEGKVEIKAPHFVHWIQDVLSEKYEDEALVKWWLVIKTTLDYTIQQRAEQAIAKNYGNVKTHGVNNAGLVYINSTNGDVLAYVWSADYFDEKIDGKVDMVRALRQPWSSIKPLIYALWFEKLPLTLDTPIFDVPLVFPDNTPSNFDWKFQWYLPLRQALAYSRNIPAIKVFLAAGWEKIVKPYLKALWLNSLSNGTSYGYPLAIGAWEVQMLELANGYMHLSRAGEPAQINPILEIRTNDNAIVYQKQTVKQNRVMSAWAASLVRSVLSRRENMPPWRIGMSTIPGLVSAIKSGTSDVKVKQDNGSFKTLPRDWWLVSYTPSRVALFRAGNTKGEPLKENAHGITLNSPIRKDFFTIMKTNNYIANETFPSAETRWLTINKYTGRQATDITPAWLKVETQWYMHNLPAQDNRDGEEIQYDTLCLWKWTSMVPHEESAIGYVFNPQSFMPDSRDVEEIKKWMQTQTWLFLKAPETVCEERWWIEDKNIVIEILKPVAGATMSKMFEVRYDINATRPVKSVRIFLNDIMVAENSYKQAKVTDIKQVAWYAWFEPWEHLLTIEAIDEEWFQNKKSIALNIITTDVIKPYLIKDKLKIDKQENGTWKIYFLFADDESVVKWGTIAFDNEMVNFDGNLATITVNPETVTSIKYSVSDIYTNTQTETLLIGDLVKN